MVGRRGIRTPSRTSGPYCFNGHNIPSPLPFLPKPSPALKRVGYPFAAQGEQSESPSHLIELSRFRSGDLLHQRNTLPFDHSTASISQGALKFTICTHEQPQKCKKGSFFEDGSDLQKSRLGLKLLTYCHVLILVQMFKQKFQCHCRQQMHAKPGNTFFFQGGLGVPHPAKILPIPPPHPTLVPVFGPRLVRLPPSRGSSPKI